MGVVFIQIVTFIQVVGHGVKNVLAIIGSIRLILVTGVFAFHCVVMKKRSIV